jgi:hypothetical protein
MIIMESEQLRIWGGGEAVVACFNAHPCMRLERTRKTRKNITNSPETLNILTLEYEDKTLRWRAGFDYPVTQRHIPEQWNSITQ